MPALKGVVHFVAVTTVPDVTVPTVQVAAQVALIDNVPSEASVLALIFIQIICKIHKPGKNNQFYLT
jgi:hypothetical protein